MTITIIFITLFMNYLSEKYPDNVHGQEPTNSLADTSLGPLFSGLFRAAHVHAEYRGKAEGIAPRGGISTGEEI